jgi:hypothetical protein
MEHVMGKLNY